MLFAIDADDFTLMGLPRRFRIDQSDLAHRWRALQAEVHPDRFAADGGASQRVAMQWSVRVNEAHRRLRDPVRRGAYLCALAGVDVESQKNTAMPGPFLQQQMAWRESLERIESRSEMEALRQEVQQHKEDLLQEVAEALDDRGDAQAAAVAVRALMFVVRVLDDIEDRLESVEG